MIMSIHDFIFVSLLILVIISKQSVSGFISEKEEMECEKHCDLVSLSPQNCATDVFCECNGGRLDCHRLDIFCMEHENDVCLKTGECITYENETVSMGLCPYYPRHLGWADYCSVPLKVYQKLPVNFSELTSYFCGDYNREGPLCSKCKPGYGPAVYAFSLMCVKCNNDGLGWLLYIFLVLFPITAFYIFIIVFNIRATHPMLMSLIFMSQVFSSTDQSYLTLSSVYQQHTHTRWLHQLVKALCGIWNLDFFRNLIPPFCLSSHLSNIHALYLESLYIVYPLALILITYVVIELHANNFKPIVQLWRPFHRCFSRLRRAWDPKASIINTFSSFFLLTSSRTISAAIRSLHKVKLYKLSLTNDSSVHYSTSVLYFDPDAQPTLLIVYGVTLILFFLFPTLLLCINPFKCIRVPLEHCFSFKSLNALRVFIDTFHGHCKDGTDGTRDFRAVSGIHMFVLLAVTSLQIFWQTALDSQPVIPLMCFAASIFIALIRPYKKSSANVVTSIMFGLTAFYLTVISHTFAEHKHVKALIFFLLTCVLAPHLILIGYIIYQLCLKYYKHIHFCKSKFVNFNNEDAQLLV